MQKLKKYERLRNLRELFLKEVVVYPAILPQTYGVAPSTIWRDLAELEEEGFIKTSRGRAALTTAPAVGYHPLPTTESRINPSAAKAVAQLISENQAVILDWGPVSLQIAQHVSKDRRAMVVTNSPIVGRTFQDHPKIDVWVIGGKQRGEILVPSKKEEVPILQRIRAEICVLGTCNIDSEAVSTSDSEQEAELKSEMMSSASKVVVTVTAESLGSTSGYLVGPLKKITHIVTAGDIPAKKLRPYENKGITVIR